MGWIRVGGSTWVKKTGYPDPDARTWRGVDAEETIRTYGHTDLRPVDGRRDKDVA